MYYDQKRYRDVWERVVDALAFKHLHYGGIDTSKGDEVSRNFGPFCRSLHRWEERLVHTSAWVECSIGIDGRNDRISVNRSNRTSRHRYWMLSRDKTGFPRFRWGAVVSINMLWRGL